MDSENDPWVTKTHWWTDSDARALRNIVAHLGTTQRSPEALLAALQQSDLPRPTWETVALLASRVGWDLHISRNGASLLVALLAGRFYQRHLDAWAGAGVLTAALAEKDLVVHSTAIERNPTQKAIGELIIPPERVEWLAGDPLDVLQPQATSFDEPDLVTVAAPLGMQIKSVELDGAALTDSADVLVIALAARSMAPDGDCFAFVRDGIFTERHRRRGIETIEAAGLHIWAAISLPATWSSLTTVPTSLVLIRRLPTPDGQLWVGRAGEEGWESLAQNLWARKAGRTIELGAILGATEYRGWQAFSAAQSLESAARALPYPGIALRDLALGWKRGQPNKDFTHQENALYLPLIGNSNAVSDPANLTVKQQNVIQIILDPTKASADFVAEFFNSPLGQQIRTTMSAGGVIPKANTDTVLSAKAYLPSLATQGIASSVNLRIRALSAAIEAYDRQLWTFPMSADKIERALSRFGQTDALRGWLATLPFPLASILWTYRAANSPTKKKDHLFHFFEALAQFLVTLHLSALTANPEFFQLHADEIVGKEREEVELLRHSTFGVWTTLGARLAATVRRLASAKEGPALVGEMFHAADRSWIDAITGKDLFSALDQISRYRNDWKGHGGIESDNEARRRLGVLEEMLQRTQQLLPYAFDDVLLIRPGKASFSAGIYEFTVGDLTGPTTPFPEVEIEVLHPLDEHSLYLHDRRRSDALELVPLLRMAPGPPENTACYFFNRLDGGETRWLSYHHEEEAEITIADPRLSGFLDRLAEEPNL